MARLSKQHLMRTNSLLTIAKEETSPEQYEKFAPIVRGPLFALLNLLLLGFIAVPTLLYRKLFKKPE